MKVVRNSSKAIFRDLAIGDKYYGHKTGKLCRKVNSTQGVRQSDLEMATVPGDTVVKIPIVKGKLSTFGRLKAGQAFIRQGVSDAESYVQIKTGGGRALRAGNGQVTDVRDGQTVEVLDGVYTFSGAR